MTTKQKELAINRLEQLDIYKPYIQGFKRKNTPCVFSCYAGFWAYQYEDLDEKIKAFEKKHNALVYAITHEITEFGELYDFLFIPSEKNLDDEYFTKYSFGDEYIINAYVWNKTQEEFSEFGDIMVRKGLGGIKRVM